MTESFLCQRCRPTPARHGVRSIVLELLLLLRDRITVVRRREKTQFSLSLVTDKSIPHTVCEKYKMASRVCPG